MRLALFTSKFPVRGDTYFSRDVRGLVDAGVAVDVFPVRPVDPSLWKWVPEILGEEHFDRRRVHGMRPWELPGELRLSTIRALPRFLDDAVAVSRSALPFGVAPFAKSAYALTLAWIWSR